jgi:hypothetical protein
VDGFAKVMDEPAREEHRRLPLAMHARLQEKVCHASRPTHCARNLRLRCSKAYCSTLRHVMSGVVNRRRTRTLQSCDTLTVKSNCLQVARLGIKVPPLCACHDVSPLDPSYPEHCASNCSLYRNDVLYYDMLLSTLQALGISV